VVPVPVRVEVVEGEADRSGAATVEPPYRLPSLAFGTRYLYRRVLRVKKGLWAVPGFAPEALPALRAGGRLACVSALVFLGEIDDAGFELHLAAPLGVTSWHPHRRSRDVVRHWSRSPLPGNRLAVDSDTAWAQFALCRAVAGRDVQLRRTDSL